MAQSVDNTELFNLKQANSELTNEVSALIAKITKKDREVVNILSSLVNASQDAEKYKALADELQRKVSSLESELSSYQKASNLDVERLNTEVTTLSRDIGFLVDKNADLSNTVHKLKVENAQLRNDLEKHLINNVELRSLADTLNADNNDIQVQNKALQSDNALLTKKLDELEKAKAEAACEYTEEDAEYDFVSDHVLDEDDEPMSWWGMNSSEQLAGFERLVAQNAMLKRVGRRFKSELSKLKKIQDSHLSCEYEKQTLTDKEILMDKNVELTKDIELLKKVIEEYKEKLVEFRNERDLLKKQVEFINKPSSRLPLDNDKEPQVAALISRIRDMEHNHKEKVAELTKKLKVYEEEEIVIRISKESTSIVRNYN